ncbi:histidine phosphatase family protein [Frankia sp. CNm7]|uniref:Histidine phosphatase family protein n=1 Tax=Frankia nepalensis TaxID=1836974 RepID=A0A937URB2_9ACTN|nr:histidine phosphatase family protein [Frankia nepalensis]MBL7495671.1 histidine phosphatase family protein [Frankia nepalensis]MBL7510263.1 histidine phosphatase family protein [Frankia nepalensis]MBL7520481.1 histidine phosphatase family protein [Frankia nepalensis]MBL7631172.1 histidine phosphatase family protein [Frankia nepalensis]
MSHSTEIVIVRHGEAACNVAGIVGGDKGCTGLTETGRAQAEQLAKRLASEHAIRPYNNLYATPRRRVVETARIVANTLNLPETVETELRGPDHGEADGRPWTEIKTAFGGPPQHNPDQPYAPGSESWNGYLTRAIAALETILRRHGGQRILVVAHGETIEAAHNLLLDLPIDACRRFGYVTDHTAITRWYRQVNRFGQATWLLAAHNDTTHLPGTPR